MLAAAQLAQFPDINTRIVDRRSGRLEVGQADGIQPRSVETFQAFGFADRIVAEGCLIVETAFWKPDPQAPARIVRTSRVLEDPNGVSEFPHITVNQARVLDYFAEAMANAPTRMRPDWGLEFQGLAIADTGEHPVTVTLVHSDGPHKGQTRRVRARYVVGADGSGVQRLTTSSGIDTEPRWSADGASLFFTSDRGGSPQISRAGPDGSGAQRVTFDGSYNVSPRPSPDGKTLAYITRREGRFQLAVMDLASRQVQVLTDSHKDESPSFAPNGRMILIATEMGGRGVLSAVSTDGRIKQRLSISAGDVREPAWAPYQR